MEQVISAPTPKQTAVEREDRNVSHLTSYHPLLSIRLEYTFLDELPGDTVKENRVRQILNAAYSEVLPTPSPSPVLAAWSQPAGTCENN
jgi:hypothetical protein